MIERVVSEYLEENCYLIQNEKGITVIDPGPRTYGKVSELIGSETVTLLLTHGHGDHIFDADRFKSAAIYIHPMDYELLFDPERNFLNYFGKLDLRIDPSLIKDPVMLEDEWKVLHTPGHTPGSCCYIYEEDTLFSGDTVFIDSIGRTDLPGGNSKEMVKSIELLKELFALKPELRIFPGHGPGTLARDVLRFNPFFK